MATPLLIWDFREGSGTTVNDRSSGTPANVTLTPGASGAWDTSRGANKTGYNFAGTATGVTGSLSGTKVQTALSGSTTVTIEFVIDSAASASTYDEYFKLQDGSGNGVVGITVNHSQGGLLFSAGEGNSPNDCSIKYAIATSGIIVGHVTLNTGTAAATDRPKVYIAGSRVTPTVVDQVGLNVTVDQGVNWSTSKANFGEAGAVINGKVYYLAIYATELSAAEVAANAAALASNDDADPNSAGAVTIPFRRLPFDVSSWDDPDPSPPRRRVSPRAMPAAAAVLPFRRSNIDWNQYYEPTLYYQGTRSALVQPGPPGPTGFTRPWLAAAASAWEPEAPPFVRARLFPPPSAAPLATSNPFTRPWLLTALDTWTPEYPAPATRLHYPRAVSAGPPTPPVPPTQPTNTGPFDWRADYAAIIGQMFRGGSFPFQT